MGMEMDYIKTAANITPSNAQFNWQKTEFYAFAHFGVNTYTNREWGDGTEEPRLFYPVKFNAKQWVNAIKSAGMRGLILTAKHHDGFCLWQSETTKHCMKGSPYKNGMGDIVAEVAQACKDGGIKFGVYLSPWDRNAETYGTGEAYNKFYERQLRELLSNYGELFSIWFDGACGEGPNGKKQEYDWENIMQICHELQPNAVTFNVGDIRWCGNEAGDCREQEWSVLPKSASDIPFIFSQAQQIDDLDGSFRKSGVKIESRDLGSRRIIKGEKDFIWYPCETDTSIRPGWFYHSSEDNKVRGLEELLDIYYNSVGGNSTLLLNIPPMPNGLFNQNDVKRLAEIGESLKAAFANNFASNENVKSNVGKNILIDDESYFIADKYNDGDCVSIELDLGEECEFNKVVICENIKIGQRIERFNIEVDGIQIYNGLTVGYKKIARFGKIKARFVKINILESRTEPTVRFVGIY